MNPRRFMLELNRSWPHQLEIKRYAQRSAAGVVPKLGDLMKTCKELGFEFATWRKDQRGNRIFGFKSKDARIAFMSQINIEFTFDKRGDPVGWRGKR